VKLSELFNVTEAINTLAKENLPFEVSYALIKVQKRIEKEMEIFNEALQKDERQKFIKETQIKLAEMKNKETEEYKKLQEELNVTIKNLEETAQEKIKSVEVDDKDFPFIAMKVMEKCTITKVVKDPETKETVSVKVGVSPSVIYNLFPVIRNEE